MSKPKVHNARAIPKLARFLCKSADADLFTDCLLLFLIASKRFVSPRQKGPENFQPFRRDLWFLGREEAVELGVENGDVGC